MNTISPAALGALLDGDLENAIIAMMPGGIEAQEAAGQRSFVASETLPGEVLAGTREELEAMGIEYIEQVDDLFWRVNLPEGWKRVSTDHSMWSHLVDDKGRQRASIFYKAAFYDRRAHVGINSRFSYRVQRVNGWDTDDGLWHGVVLDGETVIWSTPEKLKEPANPEREYWDAKDALAEQARMWLKEHYPDWGNRLSYWD